MILRQVSFKIVDLPVNDAQITIDKTISYTESSTINDFPSSGPVYKPTKQECSRCLGLQDKVIRLSEALQRISIPTADHIPQSEFEFTILKENYEMVKRRYGQEL